METVTDVLESWVLVSNNNNNNNNNSVSVPSPEKLINKQVQLSICV